MPSGSYRHVCDICGDDTWDYNQLKSIGGGQLACPYDFPGFHTADLKSARKYTLKRSAKPRRSSGEASVTELWKKSEAEVFNLLASWHGTGVAPYRYLDVTNGDGSIVGGVSVRAAGWTCVYLHSLINEGRRPKSWIDRANTQLRYFADWLLTQQNGSSTQSSTITSVIGSSTSTQTDYGGFPTLESSPTYTLGYIYSEDVAVCGLALLRAFQVLGDEKYRTGYRLAMTCMRRMQQGGKLTLRHGTTTSGGTDVYTSGMFDHVLTLYDGLGLGGGPGDGGAALCLRGNAFGAADGTETFSSASRGQMVDFDLLPGSRLRAHMGAYVTGLGGETITFRIYVGGTQSAADGTLIATITDTGTSISVTGMGSAVIKPTGFNYVKMSAQTQGAVATISSDQILLEVL